jgi:hypothetical protein
MDVVSGPGGHNYDTLVVYWTDGCPANDLECARVEVPLSSVAGVGVLSSQFTGRIIAGKTGHYLAIDPHTFDFNYGAIALALFEQVILPGVFGVGSIREALGQMIDCVAIADEYFPTLDEITENSLALYACEQGLDILVQEVVGRLTGAQVAVPGLSLATSTADSPPHCPLYEASYGPGETIRRFVGMGKADSRCKWEAYFGQSAALPANFTSAR